jgi:hypothetical protein
MVDQLADMTSELEALRNEVASFRGDLGTLKEWLIQLDHEQTEFRHDLGEVTLRIGQWMRTLESEDAGKGSVAAPDSHEGP